jgi:murein DD-endopeptidase MepM/ murein hydrolase activator NlpD
MSGSAQAAGQPATRINEPAGGGPRVAGAGLLPASTRGSLQRLHSAAPRYAPAVRHRQARVQPPAAPVYQDPFRGVSGLLAERVDMGADFAGTGPVYAIGAAVITNATASNGGWPGGGWITYRLTDGPDAGLLVYVAEDVTPAVQVGQQVSASTVIANMYSGGDGIETGWAMPDGASAESEMTAAGGISGGGPFPTMIGLSFDSLLTSLGVPAGSGGQSGYGVLPAGYPAAAG